MLQCANLMMPALMKGPAYDPIMADQSLLAELGDMDEEGGHHEEAVLLQHLLDERGRLRASREDPEGSGTGTKG